MKLSQRIFAGFGFAAPVKRVTSGNKWGHAFPFEKRLAGVKPGRQRNNGVERHAMNLPRITLASFSSIWRSFPEAQREGMECRSANGALFGWGERHGSPSEQTCRFPGFRI